VTVDLHKFRTAVYSAQRMRQADRADVVAGAVLQIMRRRFLEWVERGGGLASMRGEIAATLREEFFQVQQQTVSEIRPEDE
jgi:hypothetical protein